MISIKIKDPLFIYHARLVNILDFNPKKLTIEKVCAINDNSRDRNVIRFDTNDTLPLYTIVSVYSMTIVIRSVYKTCCDKFYPQIHLANCIYKTC